jgi:hypothetical protein
MNDKFWQRHLSMQKAGMLAISAGLALPARYDWKVGGGRLSAINFCRTKAEARRLRAAFLELLMLKVTCALDFWRNRDQS